MEIGIRVMAHGKELDLPQYATAMAAGCDLKAAISQPIVLEPYKWELVPTGICLEIPNGYQGEVRPRSGLAWKYGVTVLNSPGTIDADYRGEIKVMLVNLGDNAHTIVRGDRIAQLVVLPYVKVKFKERPNLSTTKRGDGGFGHTGK